MSERVQRGITSRGFAHGVYPARDDYAAPVQRVLPRGDGFGAEHQLAEVAARSHLPLAGCGGE